MTSVDAITRSFLSRRTLMKGIGAGAAGITLGQIHHLHRLCVGQFAINGVGQEKLFLR